MSISRSLRRKVKRAMVNNTVSTDQAEKMIETYTDLPRHRQEMYNNALGDMVLLFAGFQRIYEKRGKKKISEAVEQFVSYCNSTTMNHIKRKDIANMLEKETGYNFFVHADKLELVIQADFEDPV